MPNVTANGIQIEYDTFGDSSSPPLLLIMGFGGQMILWDPEFCRQVAEAGLHVIRFDNLASTTGNPGVAPMDAEAIDSPIVPRMPVPREREANIEYTVKGMRELAGPGIAFDEKRARGMAEALYDRCFYPEGTARQFLALLASGNRRPALARLALPTLVIHGECDPLVPVEHGKDTAEAVPGADLLIIEGMGHNLPREVWPRIVAAIAAHTRKAG